LHDATDDVLALGLLAEAIKDMEAEKLSLHPKGNGPVTLK
jgi:hypothetical protein